MNYITLAEFKNFYGITVTTDDTLITQLIKDAGFYFDLGKDLTARNTTWRQRSFNKNSVRLKHFPINNIISIDVMGKIGNKIITLTDKDYYIEGSVINVYVKGHFLDFSANIGYFPIGTIPEEIKSLTMSITKLFYDEYKKNLSTAAIRDKTIGNFKLSYFEKKVEKTGLYDIIENIRGKYGIVKTTLSDVQFYMI